MGYQYFTATIRMEGAKDMREKAYSFIASFINDDDEKIVKDTLYEGFKQGMESVWGERGKEYRYAELTDGSNVDEFSVSFHCGETNAHGSDFYEPLFEAFPEIVFSFDGGKYWRNNAGEQSGPGIMECAKYEEGDRTEHDTFQEYEEDEDEEDYEEEDSDDENDDDDGDDDDYDSNDDDDEGSDDDNSNGEDEKDLEDAKTFSKVARGFQKDGNYAKAIEHYTFAIDSCPLDATITYKDGVTVLAIADTLNDRAYAYKGLGQLDKAVEDLNKALKLDPDSAMFWDSRAEMYEAQGEYQKAIADCKKTLELNPPKDSDEYKAAQEILARCEAALNKAKPATAKPAAAKETTEGAYLSGISFCFTGELESLKRKEAEDKVKAQGGTVKSAVVKDLTYLVTNDTDSGSSKNKKAQEIGVKIIDEKTFLAVLAGKKTAKPAPKGNDVKKKKERKFLD